MVIWLLIQQKEILSKIPWQLQYKIDIRPCENYIEGNGGNIEKHPAVISGWRENPISHPFNACK